MKGSMEVPADMGDVFICSMACCDIPQVMEIERLSFTIPWSEASFENEVEKNLSARYIVAKTDDKIVGYGGMWIILDEGHITNIAVHPDYRGTGIGNLLVEGLIDTAKNEGVGAITLEVRRNNTAAKKLYKKYGFEFAGIRPRYYSDNGEDAIIMWKRDV